MPIGDSVSAILSEQPDEVLIELRERLETRVDDARAELAQAETELHLVELAIGARTARQARGDAERERKPDGRFRGIPRARILTVAKKIPYPITPARVVKAFREQGENVNTEQIRVALNRIAKDGNLIKVGPSVFAVPGSLSAPEVTRALYEDARTPTASGEPADSIRQELSTG